MTMSFAALRLEVQSVLRVPLSIRCLSLLSSLIIRFSAIFDVGFGH